MSVAQYEIIAIALDIIIADLVILANRLRYCSINRQFS